MRKRFFGVALGFATMLGFAAASFAQAPPSTHILWSVDGEAAYNHFGVGVASAGDVNGDGNSDFLVGAPTYQPYDPWGNSGRGRVYLYSGSDGSTIFTATGIGATDLFGQSIDGGADFSGDGVPDFIVGASGYSNAAGGVFMYANNQLLHVAGGDYVGDGLGYSVTFLGDIDGDGKADVLAGAPFYSLVDDGRVYLYSGATGGLIYAKDPAYVGGFDFGWSVADVGDINGDGKDDFLGGSPGAPWGMAELHSGADGAFIHKFQGQFVNDQFGTAVGGGGDVNKDGVPDMIIGAPNYKLNQSTSGAGKVYVYSGANWSLLYSYQGTQGAMYLGQTVANPGDVNHDGNDDILAGAPGEDTQSLDDGAAYIYSGATGALIRKWIGDVNIQGLGFGIGKGNDVNGDTLTDVFVGASNAKINGQFQTGRAYALRIEQALSEPSPGIAGQQNSFTCTSATPGATVSFYRSLSSGRAQVSGCPGLALEMEFPELMGTAAADSTGTATLTANIPGTYAGRIALFQAVEPTTCLRSKRTRFQFPP